MVLRKFQGNFKKVSKGVSKKLHTAGSPIFDKSSFSKICLSKEMLNKSLSY